MVPEAVAGVCLGDAGSAAGPGQLSLVSMASVVAGGIRFAVPVLKSRRCRFILEYSDCIRQDRAFGDSSSPSALYGSSVSFQVAVIVWGATRGCSMKEERL